MIFLKNLTHRSTDHWPGPGGSWCEPEACICLQWCSCSPGGNTRAAGRCASGSGAASGSFWWLRSSCTWSSSGSAPWCACAHGCCSGPCTGRVFLRERSGRETLRKTRSSVKKMKQVASSYRSTGILGLHIFSWTAGRTPCWAESLEEWRAPAGRRRDDQPLTNPSRGQRRDPTVRIWVTQNRRLVKKTFSFTCMMIMTTLSVTVKKDVLTKFRFFVCWQYNCDHYFSLCSEVWSSLFPCVLNPGFCSAAQSGTASADVTASSHYC